MEITGRLKSAYPRTSRCEGRTSTSARCATPGRSASSSASPARRPAPRTRWRRATPSSTRSTSSTDPSPASTTITSRTRSEAGTSPSTPPSPVRTAPSSSFRCAPGPCTRLRSLATPRIGSTRISSTPSSGGPIRRRSAATAGAGAAVPRDVDVVAAGSRARASPTAETNVDRSYVGQPVQIVWDVGVRGGGGSARGGVLRGGVQNPRRRTEARRRPGARRRVHGSGGDGGVGRHGGCTGTRWTCGSRESRQARAKRTRIPGPGVCALLRRPLAQGGRLRPQAGDDGGVAGRGGARDGR